MSGWLGFPGLEFVTGVAVMEEWRGDYQIL